MPVKHTSYAMYTKKNGKCHYFIQILVGCSFSVLPSDFFADTLAPEMPIYNFSGRHTVENIFHGCSLPSHPKHFHGYKTNFRRIQEAVSLPFHWLAWTISVVMNKGFYRLCWGRGVTVRIHTDWSRRVDWSKSKPAWRAASCPVSSSMAP